MNQRTNEDERSQDTEGCGSHQAVLTGGSSILSLGGAPGRAVPGRTPRRLHYHGIEDVDGDVHLSACRDRHQHIRDGHSIEQCQAGVFPPAVMWNRDVPRNPAHFKASDVDGKKIPMRCKSWRCEKCRPYVFRRDFARIMGALESRRAWLFSVQTVIPERWKGGEASAYRNFWRGLQRLRQRLSYMLGKPVEYVAVIEAHVSGWPHANLLLTWEGLDQVKDLAAYSKGIERWMKDNAPSCGLGYSVYCEPVADVRKVGSYCAGTAAGMKGYGPKDGDLRRTAAETLKKARQTPLNAPLGFRRLRASRGLLPPILRGDGTYEMAFYRPKVEAQAGGSPVAVGAGVEGAAPPRPTAPAGRLGYVGTTHEKKGDRGIELSRFGSVSDGGMLTGRLACVYTVRSGPDWG